MINQAVTVRRPLVWLAVCWVAGNAAVAAGNAASATMLGVGLIALLSALVVAGRLGKVMAVLLLAAYVLSAVERMAVDLHHATGLPELAAASQAEFPNSLPIRVRLSGELISPVAVDGDRASFRIRARQAVLHPESAQPERVELRERLLIHVRLQQQEEQQLALTWQRGGTIEAEAELKLPAEAANYGAFDYRRYLRSQRIHWLASIEGAGAIRYEAGDPWTVASLLGRVDQARSKLASQLNHLYPDGDAGYMKGLVIGMRDDMDPEQYLQFSGLGMSHILAVSGLHIAVFLYGLTLLLRLLRLTRESRIDLLLAAVPIYVLLSGASPSVVRAGIMALIGLLAARRQTLKDGLHVLAAAALVMLAADPYLLDNVSFQFSFLVTAGLILGVPPLRRALPDWGKGKALLDTLAVSVVAELVAFPLTLYYFNSYNLLSLPANLVLVPLISSVSLPLGTLSLLLFSIWQPLGEAAAWLVKLTNRLTFDVITQLDGIAFTKLIWPSPPLWWLALWLAAVLLLIRLLPSAAARSRQPQDGDSERSDSGDWLSHLAAGPGLELPGGALHEGAAPALTGPLLPLRRATSDRQERSHHTGAIAWLHARRLRGNWRQGTVMLLLLGLLGYGYAPHILDHAAYVQMLDVGQGEALLVRSPQGKHMLIDGGGTVSFRKASELWRERRDPFEVGRKLVVPLLKQRGVQQLEMVVVTHLDSDHIGGLQAVLETIPVKRLLWNGSTKPGAADARRLLQTALDKGIPVYAPCGGDRWELETHMSIEVLWPSVVCAEDDEGPPAVVEVKEQNEQSVVLLLKLYSTTLLLTGDMEAGSERRMVERLQAQNRALGPIDVLKVAHHGSRTSTTELWLRYWQPAVALISAGRSNLYGHPHPMVTGRLDEQDIILLRTDSHGEIQLRITAQGLAWRTRFP